jgi:hypothetical protein
VQRPYGIDLRAHYKNGNLEIVGGVAANFGGYTAYKPEVQLMSRVDIPFTCGITVNPQYDLGFMYAGLIAEYKFHDKQKSVADPYHMFNTGVYIRKNIGRGSFWAAVTVEGLALDDRDELDPLKNDRIIPWKQGIRWGVPVGLRYTL